MVGYRVKKMEESWAIYNNSRGIHILELNATTCLPKNLNIFDAAFSTNEMTRFKKYVDIQAPNGTYMIGYSVGKACNIITNSYFVSRFNMNCMGSEPYALAFIYVKGGFRDCVYQDVQNSFGYGLVMFITSENSESLFSFVL